MALSGPDLSCGPAEERGSAGARGAGWPQAACLTFSTARLTRVEIGANASPASLTMASECVKTPADFFKLQGEMMRRNFDAAVATTSKHSEAMVKLAGDAFAPISTRVSLAVEKVKQAA